MQHHSSPLRRTSLALAALTSIALAAPGSAAAQTPSQGGPEVTQPITLHAERPKAAGRHAEVGGLKIYYEIHGEGPPLLLLHGGLMTLEALGPILPALAEDHQVIAVELEGHGRTMDLDRPLSFKQMADDFAGLARQLGHQQVDVVGFSMGAGVGIRLAIDYPDLVRRLVAISPGPRQDAFYPSIRAQWPGLSAQTLQGTPMEQAYMQVAPQPDRWPRFVEKMKTFMLTTPDVTDAEIRSIKAPTLLIAADSDLVRPESVVQMFRLLGGAPEHGGMGPLPQHRLAILPGTTHFDIINRTDLLMPIVGPFLDQGAGE